MNKHLEILEKGFVVIALLLFSGAAARFLGQSTAAAGDQVRGNPLTQALWFGLYAATLPLAIAGWKNIFRAAAKDKFLVVLVGLALVSVIWSFSPPVTLRRGIAMVFTTLFGLFFAARYTLKEQMRLLTWALGIAAVLSLFYSLATDDLGDWSGIYVQKNVLGRYMVLSGILFLISARSSNRFRWVGWAGFGLSVGLILMSNSKTSLVVLIMLMVLWPLFRALQRNHTWIVPLLIHAVLLGGIALMLLSDNSIALLGALGKNATLTGRTELWLVLLDLIKEKPWLGYGYGAFWLGGEGPSAHVWRLFSWLPAHGHNGYIDLWLELGSLSLIIFIFSLFRGFTHAASWLRLVRTADGLWPLLFLVATALLNVTLNTIMAQNNLYWILYTAIVVSVPLELERVNRSNMVTAVGKRKLLKDA